ncbi:hypothetical protein SeLEV6574_g08189 [Synchytrium endobioticum]|uniref:Uncharacterized protein n=1 Tax=Synchytrium endobioticum TaxID=286115 RepID=A0A507CCW0_9FUNG|nr:hypothetical protein SeLEV6574_g08189 [Synchytrium endobioticum]
MPSSTTSSIQAPASVQSPMRPSRSSSPNPPTNRPLSPIDDLSTANEKENTSLLNAYHNIKASASKATKDASRMPSLAIPIPLFPPPSSSTPTPTTNDANDDHTKSPSLTPARARSSSSSVPLGLPKARTFSTIHPSTATQSRAYSSSPRTSCSPEPPRRASTPHRPPFLVGIPNDNHHHMRSRSSSVAAPPVPARASTFRTNSSIEAAYGGSGSGSGSTRQTSHCTATSLHANHSNHLKTFHNPRTLLGRPSTSFHPPSSRAPSTVQHLAASPTPTFVPHQITTTSNIHDVTSPLLSEIASLLTLLRNPKEKPPALASLSAILIASQKTIQDLSHLVTSYQLSLATTQTDLSLALARECKLADAIQTKNMAQHHDYVKLSNFKNKAEEKFGKLKTHYKKRIRKMELDLFSERLKNAVKSDECRNIASGINNQSQVVLIHKEFGNTKREVERLIGRAQNMKKFVESRPSSPVASHHYV